jgi:dTDP-glucose pyrophosphorylase
MTNIIIPMAGLGERFSKAGYTTLKPFLPLGSKTMIQAVVENLNFEGAKFSFVINTNLMTVDDLTNNLESIISDFDIYCVDELPQGPAASSMVAMEGIDLREPLIITNCDQIIEDFNYEMFLQFCQTNEADGVLGTFNSCHPKNSYVRINDFNAIVEVKEKEVVSNIATNGFHWWKSAALFRESVLAMKDASDTVNGEYYVAPSYKYLIDKGLKILPYWFNSHYPIGIPEDYEYYKKLRGL